MLTWGCNALFVPEMCIQIQYSDYFDNLIGHHYNRELACIHLSRFKDMPCKVNFFNLQTSNIFSFLKTYVNFCFSWFMLFGPEPSTELLGLEWFRCPPFLKKISFLNGKGTYLSYRHFSVLLLYFWGFFFYCCSALPDLYAIFFLASSMK